MAGDTSSVATVGRMVDRPGPRVLFDDAAAINRLARLLLVAVGLDLIVTRLVVRLAIFVPKGEPWATISAVLGRFGAATDAFVPLVGVLLLGALLIRAGRSGGLGERLVLVALSVVAAGGFALTRLPPTPMVTLVLDSLVVAVAVGSAIRIRGAQGPAVARIGLVALACAIVFAAIGRAGANGASSNIPAIAFNAAGQLAFVLGGALVGLAGVLDMTKPVRSRRRLAASGMATTLFVLLVAAWAPSSFGAIAIWSVGLAGAVPVPIVAVALGLAVAGLPVLHHRAPELAIAASIVLLSGYGLAASGLVLAGLLGLFVASSSERSGPGLMPHGSP